MPITSKLQAGVLPSGSVDSTEIADGTIVNADINASAAIDATKIADGSVSNAEFQYIGTLTSDAQTQLGNKQPLDATLTALAAFNTNGLLTQTAADTFTGRTLTGPAAGITVSNGNGVSGNPTLALANDLSALEGLGSTGLAARTGTDTWAQRTITGPAAGITVSNGDGVSGNPTLALANDLSALEGLSTNNAFPVRTNTDTYTSKTYQESTWTPTVTLVGGAGNTVPQYSTSNARHTQIGNLVFFRLELSGDGGNEGAGTGTWTVALPVAVNASASKQFITGRAVNGANEYQIVGQISASATTMDVYYNLKNATASTLTAFTGADQNNTDRRVYISGFYEV